MARYERPSIHGYFLILPAMASTDNPTSGSPATNSTPDYHHSDTVDLPPSRPPLPLSYRYDENHYPPTPILLNPALLTPPLPCPSRVISRSPLPFLLTNIHPPLQWMETPSYQCQGIQTGMRNSINLRGNKKKTTLGQSHSASNPPPDRRPLSLHGPSSALKNL